MGRLCLAMFTTQGVELVRGGGGGGGKEEKGESEGQWVNGNEIHARTRERRDREW